MKRTIVLMALVFITSFAVAGESDKEAKVVNAAIGDDGVQRVEIFAGEYFFEPGHIIVRVNMPVEIKVARTPGIVPHNLIIKAPEAGIDINESLSSEPKVIKFIPAKTGRYAFYCDRKFLFFKNHREKGMEGVLDVTE